ncbi:MAG: SPOR domain-containing protein [Gemmobacter sp.]
MMTSSHMGVVMHWKAVIVAFVAANAIALPAAAQGRSNGPAELPPAGFTGVQYVDSRGCAFVRAGHGGQVTWVRRVSGDRRPMCGLQPTRVGMARAQAQLAADAAAPTTAADVPRVAAPAVAPAPVRPVAAAQAPAQPRAAAPVVVSQGCPARAPVAQRFELVGGGTVVLCLEPGVVITGARPGDPPRGAARALPQGGAVAAQPDPRLPDVVVPPGYRLAWRDDRLNPHRGQGSAAGDRQMAAVWTMDVPQGLLVDQPRRAAVAPAPAGATARISSKAPIAAAPPAPGGARFVQVGSFAVPANARGAEARLAALGLPVQTDRAMLRGKPVEVVRAGPFASEAEAQGALAAARRAGFGDAILRR